MSNLATECQAECKTTSVHGAITRIVEPQAKDLGAFTVRRVLPASGQRMVGPWIFFDHMGPAHFPPGEGINVRPHPHIGIATVTYLFEGEILHRDSVGSEQVIRPGDINLMIAGRGIVHSEREKEDTKKSARNLHGLQLWMALPESHEFTDPAFYHYPSDEIPALTVDGVAVRIIMGRGFGVESPVKVFSPTLYMEAHIPSGKKVLVPEAPERGVYIASGEASINGQQVPEHSMAIIEGTADVVIQAERDSRIAVVGGEAPGRRYIEWNFVASQREFIEQAKTDWKNGKFPKVPGDDVEFIPLPG